MTIAEFYSFLLKKVCCIDVFSYHWILVILRPNYINASSHLNESKFSPEVSPEP